MIYRPSPRDDERTRFEAVFALDRFLARNRPPGVDWKYDQVPPFRMLGLRVWAEGAPGQLAVVPVWFLGPHRNDFIPFPVGGPASFQVVQLHWRGAPESEPSAYEHVVYGDAPAVLAAISRWQKSAADAGEIAVPPIGPEDLNRLRSIAASVRVPPQVVIEVDAAAPSLALADAATNLLAADLEHLSSRLLGLNVPRDDRGRLALGACVLLMSYESGAPLGGKRAWLTALTPARRRDPQSLRISLQPLAADPYAQRWDDARWLWDTRAATTPEGVRWGVEGLDLALLDGEERMERIRALSKRCASDSSPADQVALCILLQDEGRLDEALALFGIGLGDDVMRLVRGLPISGYLGTSLQSWIAFVRRQLRGSAPWLMPGVIAAEVARREGLSSRPRRPPRFRLCPLPHQTTAARRSLMLVARKRDGTDLTIEIENTGWNYRLAEPSWKRPLEIDLRRFGLIAPCPP